MIKINIIICFLFIATMSTAQNNNWPNDLVVSYKMTDKNGNMLNSVEIEKDTINYTWIEKNKVANKKLISDTALENKIIVILKKHKFLKFKSYKRSKPGPNIIFIYSNKSKRKTIVMPQKIKVGSKEELFVKEFLESIILKAFASDIKKTAN